MLRKSTIAWEDFELDFHQQLQDEVRTIVEHSQLPQLLKERQQHSSHNINKSQKCRLVYSLKQNHKKKGGKKNTRTHTQRNTNTHTHVDTTSTLQLSVFDLMQEQKNQNLNRKREFVVGSGPI